MESVGEEHPSSLGKSPSHRPPDLVREHRGRSGTRMSQSAGRFQAFPEPGGSDLNEAFCPGRGIGSSSNPEGWILGSPYSFLCGLRLCVTPHDADHPSPGQGLYRKGAGPAAKAQARQNPMLMTKATGPTYHPFPPALLAPLGPVPRHRRKWLPLALPTTKPSPIPITVKFKQAKRCLVYA